MCIFEITARVSWSITSDMCHCDKVGCNAFFRTKRGKREMEIRNQNSTLVKSGFEYFVAWLFARLSPELTS